MHKEHKRWRNICKYLEQKGVEYDYVQSESFGSVERLISMLCDNGYHTIVIVGGDSALNDAVNAIMGKLSVLPADFAFGIIPNGISNDFARFWGLTPNDFRENVDCLINRKIRPVDVAYCEYTEGEKQSKRYFINCVNIGLGARLVKITNESLRLIGSKRLSLIPVLLSRIFERKSFKLKLRIDTEEIEGSYMSVCIGNSLGYGQTPNGVPYNGMLDVSVITRPKWWQMFEGFWLLGKGRFLNYKNVSPYRSQSVLIQEQGKATISLDGCVLTASDKKKLTPMKIGVEKEILNFIAP